MNEDQTSSCRTKAQDPCDPDHHMWFPGRLTRSVYRLSQDNRIASTELVFAEHLYLPCGGEAHVKHRHTHTHIYPSVINNFGILTATLSHTCRCYSASHVNRPGQATEPSGLYNACSLARKCASRSPPSGPGEWLRSGKPLNRACWGVPCMMRAMAHPFVAMPRANSLVRDVTS